MTLYITYAQIALAVVLVGLILLQHSDASIGSAFGGDSLSGTAHTRRGPEKIIFVTTIVIAVLFAVSALAVLLLR